MSPAPIFKIRCIVIDGTDARHFAQAQFSGDVRALRPGHWQWNAWLDAQGRVRALMHLADVGDGTLLAVLRGGEAETIHAGLARYLLRAHATLSVHTLAGYADHALPLGSATTDQQDVILGYGDRSLRLDHGGAEPVPAASNPWRLADIRAGWPKLPRGEAQFLPPALGLERLGAVAFQKGCYPGQEISARLHFRGGHKLRLQHVRGPVPLPTGSIRDPDGAGTVYVLDCVPGEDGAEALVVAGKVHTNKINIMERTYNVISIFDT